MDTGRVKQSIRAALLASTVSLMGCSGGGGSSQPPAETVTPDPAPTPTPPPTPSGSSEAFATAEATSRFLTQATFGPKSSDVSALTGTDASEWFVAELNKPASFSMPIINEYLAMVNEDDESVTLREYAATFAFWRNAIEGNDQLRQRMAFALSQILVVSDSGGEALLDVPEGLGYVQDIFARNAFGNYRDILEEVTYSPAMGYFLTYLDNQKADPQTGRMPDENYAREILQLFTLGLVELNGDGTPKTRNGAEIELYTNSDVTELAKVFTGLDVETMDRSRYSSIDDALGEDFDRTAMGRRLIVNENLHSKEPKEFLNCRIPAGAMVNESIDRALDCLMDHPNIAPFISRQLIQRFTTSNPDPEYVTRVSSAFEAGEYTLPNGSAVGAGRKGDLAATLAAILFDESVRSDEALSNPEFGKIREPVLRFTHWARAFDMPASRPEYATEFYDLSPPNALSQHPYRARSVFNFYRPGFVAPGTESGARAMTVPELQIVNASSSTGYINFVTFLGRGAMGALEVDERRAELQELDIQIDNALLETMFIPDYSEELKLANDPAVLVDHLNALLTYNSMSQDTRTGIISALDGINLSNDEDQEGRSERVAVAVMLIMSSPDYLVQR